MDIQETSKVLEPLDIKLLISNLEKKYYPVLKQKKLRLKTDLSGSLILNADKSILVSILSNLLDNAVKYADENGAIYISAFKPKDERLYLRITNTYRELDALELKELFKPFHRLRHTKNPGSGLGLTIVNKQLKKCNGSITARNSKKGLMFELEFPNL